MTWYCPMHPEITAQATGQCPVCKMAAGAGQSSRHARVRARFHHVACRRPRERALHHQADGQGRRRDDHEIRRGARQALSPLHHQPRHVGLRARSPGSAAGVRGSSRRGYRSRATTTSSPTFCRRADRRRSSCAPLITADFDGDALSAEVPIQPDTIFEKTVNGMTAQVDFDPRPLLAGEHGHLTFNLTDAATRQPITDLQPYLGAFGHTLIMSHDQANAVHSHPTPDLSNDISRGRRAARDVRGLLSHGGRIPGLDAVPAERSDHHVLVCVQRADARRGDARSDARAGGTMKRCGGAVAWIEFAAVLR